MKVVVTGASSGIGAATAEAFAVAGHDVALVARRADRLAEVAARCGASASTWVADLAELDGLEALAAAIERGAGHVVNVSSMGVHSAAFGVGAYAASKAALELFTEALHLELANTGVRVHLFVPGTTSSEFSDDKPGNEPSMRRPGPDAATPEQVAAALAGCLDEPGFRTFATARDAATCAAKEADPEAFLAAARGRLAAFL